MAINDNDLNKLAGRNNIANGINSSIDEGNQTIDKIKSIIEGVNSIFSKVETFKNKNQNNQNIQDAQEVKQPTDMIIEKRAQLKINEEKIINFIKDFSNNIPEIIKEEKLSDLLEQSKGNENIIKSYLLTLIKEVTSLEYVE